MTILSVPDMTCGHCRASVTEALTRLSGTGKIDVDLATKTVRVEGPADEGAIIRALDEIGYSASVVGKD